MSTAMPIYYETESVSFRCMLQRWREPIPLRPLHRHRWIEILYVAPGSAPLLLRQNTEERMLSEGDLAILSANTPHLLTPCEGDGGECICYCLQALPELLISALSEEEEIACILPLLSQKAQCDSCFPRVTVDAFGIGALFPALYEASEARRRGERGAILLARSLLDRLLYLLGNIVTPSPSLSGYKLSSRHLSAFLALLDRIHTEYASPLSAADAASSVYLSYSGFAPLFRYMTGQSFNEYLNGVRIARSRELLLSSDLSITEVGLAVGYSTTSYFIKLFREASGLTPSRYRAQRGFASRSAFLHKGTVSHEVPAPTTRKNG